MTHQHATASPGTGIFCDQCGAELTPDEIDWGCSYCGAERLEEDGDEPPVFDEEW